jgi:hypothetical protein
MSPEFEPLQNDLIIRTAWGMFKTFVSVLRSYLSMQVLIHTGQKVERPPIWVMRQGMSSACTVHKALR